MKPAATLPRPPSRWRRLLARLLLLGLSTVLALLLAEGLVRWLAPQQLILLRPDIWQPAPELGWVQAADLDTQVNTGEREVRLRTDAQGHRIGAQDPDPHPRYRLLALGDSFLAALQVDYEQTFTALLAGELREQLGASVEVVNTGVGGWGPSHYRLAARQELAAADYQLVLVFVFLGNDVEPQRIESFQPRTGTVRHAWRWPRRLSRGELVNAWLYPLNDRLETRSHLFMLLRERAWWLLMRWGLSARRFSEVFLRSEAASPRWQVTADQCAEIAGVAAEHGVPALFVLLPAAGQVDRQLGNAYAAAVGVKPEDVDFDQPSRLLAPLLAQQGLHAVDLAAPMRADFEARGEALFGYVDTHLAPAGHAFIARQLRAPVAAVLAPAMEAP